MTDSSTRDRSEDTQAETGARQRAIEAYGSARERVSDTLTEAPMIALAGGLAAGALIAALLPRTQAEERAVRPTARRIKQSAQAALQAAKETGTQRLGEMGLSGDRAGETIRSLLSDVTEAAKASGQAALDSGRNQD